MTSVDNDRKIEALLSAVRGGRVRRRALFKRGAALGISFGFLAKLSNDAAFAQDATPDAVAPGASLTTMPAGLRTDLSGKTITFIGGEASDPANPWQQALNAKFTEATGITVNLIPAEQNANDRLTKYNQALGSQSSDTDV